MVGYIINKEFDETVVPVIYVILVSLLMFLVYNESLKDLSVQYLLEFPKNYVYGKERINHISDKNVLYQRLRNFINKYKGFKYIVSLSGGVDSMVTLGLLMNLVDNDDIYTASIDYNQRRESTAEINFVKDYLKRYGIKNYSRKVEGVSRKKENASSNRKVFEETSKRIRYDLYKDIMEENGLDKDKTIILLGHHQDDLRENIFNNFMTGRKLSDLEVMKELTIKDGLLFGRPFLDYPKTEIYRISHKYDIPYLKDTTPDWSKRGLMRRQLFPLLKRIYPNFERTLDSQGRNSYYLNRLIEDNFVDDFISNVTTIRDEDETRIFWDNNKFECDNKLVWSDRISALLHDEGVNMVSQKSLNIFMEKKICKKYVVLSKNVMLKRSKDETCLRIVKK